MISNSQVDISRLEGIAGVYGRRYQMQREDNFFSAVVVSSTTDVTSLELLLTEILPNGLDLPIARTEPQAINIVDDQNIVVSEEQFQYDCDNDGDDLSNIAERNRGTDPFTPESSEQN